MFVIFIWQINHMDDYFHFFNHCIFEVPTVTRSVKSTILKDPMAFLLDSHEPVLQNFDLTTSQKK